MSTGSDPIPQARLPVLGKDNTFSLPWLRFFQGLANGTVDPAVIAALEAEIAAASAEATNALTIAEEALSEASAAQSGITADYGIVFAGLDELARHSSQVSNQIGPPGQDGLDGGDSIFIIQQSSGGSSSLSVTDGTHTVTGTTQVTFSGATVGGSTPNATVTISGGGSYGNVLYDTTMGVPSSGSLTTFGDTGHHTLTQNSTLALNIKYTSNAGSVREITGWLNAVPVSTPYQFAVLVLNNCLPINYYGPNVGFYNSVNGKFATICMPTSLNRFEMQYYTAYNNRTSSPTLNYSLNGPLWWLHCGYDGTNLTFAVSADGKNPVPLQSEAATTNLGGAPTHLSLALFTDPLEGSQVIGQNVTYVCVDPNGLTRNIGP